MFFPDGSSSNSELTSFLEQLQNNNKDIIEIFPLEICFKNSGQKRRYFKKFQNSEEERFTGVVDDLRVVESLTEPMFILSATGDNRVLQQTYAWKNAHTKKQKLKVRNDFNKGLLDWHVQAIIATPKHVFIYDRMFSDSQSSSSSSELLRFRDALTHVKRTSEIISHTGVAYGRSIFIINHFDIPAETSCRTGAIQFLYEYIQFIRETNNLIATNMPNMIFNQFRP